MTNMMKLAISKMSRDAIPEGGGLRDAVRFLMNPQEIKSGAQSAEQWAKDAVQAVRDACDPNPWKDADDEAIAGEILRRIEERKVTR